MIVNYCIKHWALCVNNLSIFWSMIYILSWTTKKYQNTLFRPLHLKLKKSQGLFKDLHRNLRIFQGKIEFKDFSKLPLKFKDFSRLCELHFIFLIKRSEINISVRNHTGHHINHAYVNPAVVKILSWPCFSWPYSGILGPVLTFQLSHLNEGSCNQRVEEAAIKIYWY